MWASRWIGLEGQGIRYERKDWEEFRIPAGQSYRPFEKVVPADWSSATFFLVAAAITGGTLVLEGLDTADSQGDKAVVGMLEAMGCQSEEVPGGLRIIGRPLSGTVLDLNATPDALPAMAVAGCYAEGETRLVNVPQARLKETDRITVMTTELMKLGADVEELPDGMVIRGRRPAMESCVSPVLKGALVDGHDDHRVVMALAVAALGCCGQVSIRGAEAADITFPGFFKLLDKALDRNGK
jgi:3-phosphoshikimate 1-carboxyvinyltransferase